MDVSEYREVLHEDIAIAASANYSNPNDEFLTYATNILSSAEEFDDFVECYYEGLSRRKANIRIDGYSLDETDGTCCLFIADYRGPQENDSIRTDEINAHFRKIRYFIDESINNTLYRELEESTEAYEFSKQLYEEFEDITKFRFYLLTDAYNKQRTKNIKDETINGKTVELNVWDITRLFDVVNSKTQKESVEISFEDLGVSGLPCVKAVEYNDIIADIELVPHFEQEDSPEEDEKPENVISYSSYLTVVPGQVLNDIYLEYGSRLLEGNVRSFLSVRGKVNKSIQNTIKNYPEMFFAYNNGIAATATEIHTKSTDNGLIITYIKDLQIVNGGQTTASIANTLLTLKKDETVDISRLYVPMKLSVLEHSMSERIIPKISEYSNSQNKVDASDFFSNHPFHIRMEDFSRKTAAPRVRGNQYQQYWYYERTRGQYNQGKMKFKAKSSQLRAYENRYPESQVIKMVDLAKYMEIYRGFPDIVSKGKQEIVKDFAARTKAAWDKSQTNFNANYYKRVVALAIIFKATDEIIKDTDWYKEKHSYKANVIAYTMSTLFYLIRNRYPRFRFDFGKVWRLQEIYPELKEELRVLCTEVYHFLTRDDRAVENVTQWCKQKLCWEKAQKVDWTLTTDFVTTLISSDIVQAEEKEAKEDQKVDNEVALLKTIIARGSVYWNKVLDWGNERKLLSESEDSILRLIINIEKTGRTPSVKQAKVIIKTRERLISEGMPLEFT